MATTFVLAKRSGALLTADTLQSTFSPQLAWTSSSADDAYKLAGRLNAALNQKHGAPIPNDCLWWVHDIRNIEPRSEAGPLDSLAELYVVVTRSDGLPSSVDSSVALRRGFLGALARRDEERALSAIHAGTSEASIER